MPRGSVVIAFAVVLFFILVAWAGSVSRSPYALSLRTPNGGHLSLEAAQTSEARELGLGGRAALAEDAGMLFVFPEAGRHGIWMKGMMFPLDIVWLVEGDPQTNADVTLTDADTERKLIVVDVEENVAPETYPSVFYPSAGATYVVELAGGAARTQGLDIGSILPLR